MTLRVVDLMTSCIAAGAMGETGHLLLGRCFNESPPQQEKKQITKKQQGHQ